MADEKHPIRNGIAIGVGVAFVLWISTFIPGLWAWGLLQISTFCGYLMEITKVRRWFVWLLFLGWIPGLVLLLRAIVRWRAKNKGPQVTQYRQDTFFGVVWRWDYIDSIPTGIWCFCPDCNTRLVYTEDPLLRKVYFTCELHRRRLHETNGDVKYAVAQVYRQIERKMTTGEWLKVIAPSCQ